MWEALGGQSVHLGCLTFAQVLRPFRLATHRVASKCGLPRAERALAPLVRVLDATTTRFFDRSYAGDTETDELTPRQWLSTFRMSCRAFDSCPSTTSTR